MAKLSKEEVAEIVKKHGFRVVAQQRTDVRDVEVEARTPELSKIQAKYARGTRMTGVDAAQCESPALQSLDTPVDDDESIVLVEPATKRDAFTRANRPKAKVISAKKKGFTGSQG